MSALSVTLCDPIQHVSPRSGQAGQTANCYICILYFFNFTFCLSVGHKRELCCTAQPIEMSLFVSGCVIIYPELLIQSLSTYHIVSYQKFIVRPLLREPRP